jgi:hypothetical protein
MYNIRRALLLLINKNNQRSRILNQTAAAISPIIYNNTRTFHLASTLTHSKSTKSPAGPKKFHVTSGNQTTSLFSAEGQDEEIEDLNRPVDEDLYWDKVRTSIEIEEKDLDFNGPYEDEEQNNSPSPSEHIEKNVFVLQLKMQHRTSRERQSTSAELQLAESVSLVQTLRGWQVCDSHIVGAKRHSTAREIFGAGNQELLSRRIAASGANVLFVVADRLTSSQVRSLRQTLLGDSSRVQIYDRYKLVLEIFKRNARSAIAKLQIALAEIPYIRHR